MPEIVTLGEAMFVFVPTEVGTLQEATHFQRFLGGAEADTAVALARLGHSVGFIGQDGGENTNGDVAHEHPFTAGKVGAKS